MREKHGLQGKLTIVTRNLSGTMGEERKICNIITHAGKKLLADYLAGAVTGKPELSIIVGSDDQPAKIDNTELGETLASAPAQVTVREENEAQGIAAVITAKLPALNEGDPVQSLQEAGIMIKLPDREEEILYNRTTFEVISRTAQVEMSLTWELTF